MRTFPFRRRLRRFLSLLSTGVIPPAVTHWFGVRAINVAPEQIAVREGMRAGVAVGSVMLLAWHMEMSLMAWSAFSAFWTCLVDPGGLPKRRVKAIATFGFCGTLITGLLSAASGLGLVPVFTALGICTFLCGLARMRGAIATQISVLCAIVGVVAVCYPQTPTGALQLAGLFASGSIWAALICFFAWPVDPFAPQKLACAAIFREQAAMTARLLDLSSTRLKEQEDPYHAISAYRRAIRHRIEQTRSSVEALSTDVLTCRTRARLLPAIEASDRVFAAIMGFEHAVFSRNVPPVGRRTIRLVTATLQRVARELSRPQPRPGSLTRQIAFLRTAGSPQGDLFARGAHMCADALSDLQDAWEKGPAAVGAAEEPSLRKNSPLVSGFFVRHALRLTTGVLVAYAISLALHLPYAFWAMMAVVVVTQPSMNTTLPRALERMAGSIAGGLLAALAGVALPQPVILLLIFPLAAITIALRSVNYTLCVMFMTQLFVLVTDLVATTHGWDVGLERATNNIIGSIVGLAACVLLWPEKRPAPLAERVTEAFIANLRYAALAARPEKAGWNEIEQARRIAGTSSTQAEILYQQTRLEGLRRSPSLKTSAEVLFMLRQLAGAASIWWLEQPTATAPEEQYLVTRLDEILQSSEVWNGDPLTLLRLLQSLGLETVSP